ncbi:hypothetical protein [Bartonella quintana]|nr:hypothetical protein [Bartonella quintana]
MAPEFSLQFLLKNVENVTNLSIGTINLNNSETRAGVLLGDREGVLGG